MIKPLPHHQLRAVVLFASTFLLFLVSGCSHAQTNQNINTTHTTIASRGVQIPVTYVQPALNSKSPLVVLAHGHGGTRHEAGGFTRIADDLASAGVATIRMDFSGCGDSVESFTENNLTNMLADVSNSLSFAIDKMSIDADRIGILGFSMGGRVAILAAENNPQYRVMVTWAPAGSNHADSMVDFLGGQQAFEQKKALAAKQGFVPFVTTWGQHQKLGLQWFADNEASTPLSAVESFTGELLVVYGDQDDVIAPHIPRSVINAATSARIAELVTIKGGDHGMGLFNGNTRVTDEAVNSTVEFFLKHL